MRNSSSRLHVIVMRLHRQRADGTNTLNTYVCISPTTADIGKTNEWSDKLDMTSRGTQFPDDGH